MIWTIRKIFSKGWCLAVMALVLIGLFYLNTAPVRACSDGDDNQWDYSCDKHVAVEVIGSGMGNRYAVLNNPALININNVDEVSKIRAQVVLKVPDDAHPPTKVKVTTASGQVKTLSSPTLITKGFGYHYEFVLNPAEWIKAEIIGDTGPADYKTPRAFVAYVFRNKSVGGSFNVGKFVDKGLWWNADDRPASHTENFSIEPVSQSRDIAVTFAISDLQNDARNVTLKATAGGISREVTFDKPNQGDELLIYTITLPGVPGSANKVSATVTSPENSGDSFYWSGVNISVPCADEEPEMIDLELKKTVNQNNPKYGDEIEFTVKLENKGKIQATNVSVKDILPSGLIYLSHTGGSYNKDTGIWNVGSLSAAASKSLKIKTRVAAIGTIKNMAEVWTADQTDVDSTPGNSLASEDDQAEAVIEAKKPPYNPAERDWQYACQDCVNVEIIGSGMGNISGTTHNPATLNISDPASVDYIIAQVAVRRVWGARDLKPAKVVISSSAGETFTLFEPTADSGGVGEYFYEVEFKPAAQLTAQIFGDNVDGYYSPRSLTAYVFRNNTSPNKNYNSGKLLSEDLRNSSKTKTFTIPTTNTSRDVAVTFVISEFENNEKVILQATAGSVSSGEVTVTSQSHGDELLIYTLTLPAVPGNVAEVQVKVKSPTSNDSLVWAGVNIAVQCLEIAPDYGINVHKSVDKSTAHPGDELHYTIDWSVSGNLLAPGVKLVDTLPEKVEFVSASQGGSYDSAAHSVSWNLGDINPAANGSLSIIGKIKGGVSHTAELINTVVMTSGAKSKSDTATTIIDNPAITKIKIEKNVDKQAAYIADHLIYTLDWEISGNTPAENVIISDDLPAETSFVSASPNGQYVPQTRQVVWTLGNQNPGAAGSLTLEVTLESRPDSGEVTNWATIRSGVLSAKDKAITTVKATPFYEVAIEKHGPAQASPTEIFDYTLDWSVTGNTTVPGVVITDWLPAEIDLMSASGGGNYSIIGNQIIWALGDKQPGDSGTITLTVRVKNHVNNGEQFTNKTQIKSGAKEDESQVTTTVVGAHYNLDIKKTANQNTILVGDNLIYTLSWFITGNRIAPNVIVTDTLPENISFVSANPVASNISGQLITWNLGDKSPGDSGTLTVEVTVNSLPQTLDRVMTNITVITSGDKSDSDTEKTLVQDYNLVIDKTATAQINPGDQITYTLNWNVTGTAVASQVVVTDTLPAGVTFVSATGSYQVNNGVITWTFNNVVPGTGTQLTLVAAATGAQAGDSLVNHAAIASGTKHAAAEATTVVVAVPYYTVNIAKSVEPETVLVGENVVYTIDWSIGGNSSAPDVVITDYLPAETEFVSADNGGQYNDNTHQVIWNLGSLAHGASGTFRLEVKLLAMPATGTAFTNEVKIASGNKYATADAVVNAEYFVLNIDKTAPAQAEAGKIIAYDIAWSVDGIAQTKSVTLTDTLPAEVVFVSATENGSYTAGTHSLVWNLGDVQAPANGSMQVMVLIKAQTPAQTNIINDALIVSGNQSAQDSATTLVVDAPYFELSIDKSDDKDPVVLGEILTYTLDWAVIGNQTATAVEVTDVLPAEVSFVSADNSGVYDATAHTVTWHLGDILPAQSGSLTLEVSVDNLPAQGDVIHNTATIASGAQSATDSEPTIVETYEVQITKDGPAQAQVGDQATYTINWAVVGTAVASQVIVTDTLPANTSFVTATGNYSTPSGQVVWDLGDQPSGANGSLTLAVKFDGVSVGDNVVNNVKIESGAKSANASVLTEVVGSSVKYYEVDVNKTGPAEVNSGDDIVFTIHWSVSGNMVAPGVVVTDTLPSNASFQSASGSYTQNNGVLTWNLGDIDATDANANSGHFTVRVNTAGLGNGTQVVNNTRITSTDKSDSASASTTVKQGGGGGAYHKVYIDKSAPAEITAGEGLAFSFFWRVTGSEAAVDVIVTDTLPQGVTFVSADHNAVYDAAAHKVVWKLGDQHQGTTGNLVLAVSTNADDFANGDKLVNNVLIRSGVETDSDTTTTTVKKGGGGGGDYTLSIAKTGPASIRSGEPITYSINWAVAGTKTAPNVVVTDTLPDNATLSSASGSYVYNPATRELVWNLGDILPAQSGSFAVVLATDTHNLANGAVVFNKVSIKSGGKEKEDTLSTTVVEEVTLLPSVKLEYDYPSRKTNSYSYNEQVRVINNGQVALTNGALWLDLAESILKLESFDKPTVFGNVKKQMFKWSIPQLGAGETYMLNFVVHVFDQDVYHPIDTYVAYYSDQANARTKGSEWIMCPEVWYGRREYDLSRGAGSTAPDATYQGPLSSRTRELSSPALGPTQSVPAATSAAPEPAVTASENNRPIEVIDNQAAAAEVAVKPTVKGNLPDVESAAAASQIVVVNNPPVECPACEAGALTGAGLEACRQCTGWAWLFAIVVSLLGLLVYWFYASKEDIKENSAGEYYIVKGNWAWVIPVLLSQAVVYLILVYVCQFSSPWLILLVLAAYFFGLVFHQALIKNGELKYSPGLPLMATVAVLAAYLWCDNWGIGAWIAVLLFYILTLLAYYLMLVKISPKSRSYWWAVILFITLLVLVLEAVLRQCQCGRIIG